MKERALAALAAQKPEGEFAADTLSWIIWHHECPEAAGVMDGRYRAYEQWQAQTPGSSDGNMRRICEALLAEGVLTKRLQVQGKYSWAYYRVKGEQS